MEKRLVVFIVLALIFLSLALRYTFFYTDSCETAECFFQNIRDCSKATFVNDNSEATWKYEILRDKGNACDIEVTLSQQKSSDLELSALEGKSMICSLPLGVVDYPEKNLEFCHGELKEEIQSTLINKLHKYIIDNLGEIKDDLNAF